MALSIDIVTGTLPVGFDGLHAEARTEGHRSLDRLAAEWAAHTTRFNRPGEALLAARVAGTLAGVGGLTLDPVMPGALRMRRFYIRPAFRRSGIARTLATILLEAPCLAGQPVTVNAGSSDAHAFWESLGFTAGPRDGHTHIKALRLARVSGAG